MHEITRATKSDVPKIVELLNLTYRSEESKKGWTTEADIIKGEVRTDENIVAGLMGEKDSWFYKYNNEEGGLIGCVHLKKNGERLYFGMLSVLPTLQGKGIGKMFLEKAEEVAKEVGCSAVYMQVISIRHELNAWYERQGYGLTGERKPFIVTYEKYGVPVVPLEFVILEKKLHS